MDARGHDVARPVCHTGRDEPEGLKVGESGLVRHRVTGKEHLTRGGEVGRGITAAGGQLAQSFLGPDHSRF